jgi:hypothetical protein
MADIVRKVAYFAMDVPNRPGEAARVLANSIGTHPIFSSTGRQSFCRIPSCRG